ncbi:MAG: hypothetical protein JEY79_11190 [Pseudodesulfovibrio sp.]|nr:hypothetical protein [Pseudodesulfovibrio sp.]
MQNRYFGNIGDFSKYGLLRKTASYAEKIGVLWCLAEDENHNNNGKHLGYLKKDLREIYRSCDPKLFDSLKAHLIGNDGEIIQANRNVSSFKNLQLLPESTVYFEDIIKVTTHPNQREEERDRWFDRALQVFKDCDLVFCDPDNGIEVSSAGKRTQKHFKYIYWDELERLWNNGKSLIIYQHMHMGKPHITQLKERKLNIMNILGTDMVLSLRCFRGTVRTYFLVPQSAHRQHFAEIVNHMTSGSWHQHIKLWNQM